jgi:predicted ATP-dependent protease
MVHTEGLASLDYREFTMNIEDICAYAISKNLSTVTSELLKQRLKDDISAGFFSYVDAERYFGGYFDQPISQVGHVNGLSAIDGKVGSIVKVRTYFVPGIDYHKKDIIHFELVDIKSEMTDETAIKGYELARDFTRMLLAKSGVNWNATNKAVDWQLKTHFGESWYGIAGPSASMAIAISMVSALADESLYKNRFITGTIDPVNGDAGRIGGAYMKSLIPLRLKQVSTQLQQENSGEFYFLLPAGNLKELTKESIFDPFNLMENVACLPVMNFRQAYHLLTCGETIKDVDFKNAQKYGEERLEETLKKIKSKF